MRVRGSMHRQAYVAAESALPEKDQLIRSRRTTPAARSPDRHALGRGKTTTNNTDGN